MNEWLKKAFDFVNKIYLDIKENDTKWIYRWMVNEKIIFRSKTKEEYEDTIWALKDELEENALFIVEEKNTNIPFFIAKEDLDNILLYKEIYFLLWQYQWNNKVRIPNFLLSSLFYQAKYSYDYYEVELSVFDWLVANNKIIYNFIKNLNNLLFEEKKYNNSIVKANLWLKNLKNIVLWYSKEGDIFVSKEIHKVIALYYVIMKKTSFEWIQTKWDISLKELLDIINNLNILNSDEKLSNSSLVKKDDLEIVNFEEIKEKNIEIINYLKNRNLI